MTEQANHDSENDERESQNGRPPDHSAPSDLASADPPSNFKKNLRRLSILELCPDNLVWLFKRHAKLLPFLPEDARVVGVGSGDSWRYSPDTHTIRIVLESETFDAVPEGELLPILRSPTAELLR